MKKKSRKGRKKLQNQPEPDDDSVDEFADDEVAPRRDHVRSSDGASSTTETAAPNADSARNTDNEKSSLEEDPPSEITHNLRAMFPKVENGKLNRSIFLKL